MNEAPLITLKNVSVKFPGAAKPIVDNVSLTVNKGERLLIAGPSGCGKSTLAYVLNGTLPRAIEAAFTGEVELEGMPLQELSVRQVAEKIGILFQDPESQFCMQTVEEEVAFGLENLRIPPAEMEVRITRSLEQVGLAGERQSQLHHLSGGMKQRLGLACILAMDPEVLILDEPTANLDPEGANELLDLVIQLAETSGKTLIFIEHRLDRIIPYIDRILLMNQEGSLIANGAPRALYREQMELFQQEGAAIPLVCQRAYELAAAGQVWDPFPLTVEEGEQQLMGGERSGDHQMVAASSHSQSERSRVAKGDAQQLALESDDDLSASAISQKLRSSETGDQMVDVENKPSGANRRRAANVAEGAALPILEVSDLTFRYKQKEVLRGVSFQLFPGEITALLGTNGAGKSTLVQLLTKLLKPQSGTIHLKQMPLAKWKERELYKTIGYVFQNPEHQFLRDTVEAELAFGLERSGLTQAQWEQKVEEQLVEFGLSHVRKHHPFQLSQGQKRRLSVATMLSNDQQVLLLDEPTFGQDARYTELLMSMITRLSSKGKSILMITHDVELVRQYADQALVLHEGRIAFDGHPQALFDHIEHLQKYGLQEPLSKRLEQWDAKKLEAIHHA